MKKKNNNYRNVIFFLVIIVIILLNVFILILNYKTTKELLNYPKLEYKPLNYTLPNLNLSNNPLSLDGFSVVNVNISDRIVLLQNNCTAFGLATNEIQIYSIRQGLYKTIDIRPTIHDTMLDVTNHFNVSLLMVKISDARDDLYFANIYLKDDKNLLNIDAKPSDAIALAVRLDIPIYIKNSILENYGQKIC